MGTVILACDNGDGSLGGFFEECNYDMIAFLQHNDVNYLEINKKQLNEVSVSIQTSQHKDFLFVAYSHGSEDSLFAGDKAYISSTINIKSFPNTFFYSCACSTAKTLGKILIENGCLSFIGYNEPFHVWDFNRAPFLECINSGLKFFLEGKSVQQVVLSMKEKYTYHIDNYNNDIFGAALLVANRNALTSHGNDNLTIKSFKNAVD